MGEGPQSDARPREQGEEGVTMTELVLGLGASMPGAVCPQTDPDAFFPEKGASPAAAKRVCGGCEHRAQCLEEGIAGDEWGVWGGFTQSERRAIKRRRESRPGEAAA